MSTATDTSFYAAFCATYNGHRGQYEPVRANSHEAWLSKVRRQLRDYSGIPHDVIDSPSWRSLVKLEIYTHIL